MCSLAVAEDIHPVVTLAPHAWKREQLRAALRAQRGCYKMCQGIPTLHQNSGRGGGGEQTETSKDQGAGLEQSCWARWHTGPCCSATSSPG